MKVSPLLFILFLVGLLTLQAEERTAEDLFFEGNVRFAEGAYADAIPLYEAAVAERPSPNIHYNLGNAYYQLGDWGRARLHWERTLAMEPRHSLAGGNLRMLLHELNLPEEVPGFWTRAAGVFSYNEWLWTGALAFWIALFSVLARQWKKNPWLTLPTGVGALGVLLAAAALFLLHPTRDLAIILDESTSLRVAPAPGSPLAASLRTAQRVRVADTYGSFVRVLLEGGSEGYLEAGQVERIR